MQTRVDPTPSNVGCGIRRPSNFGPFLMRRWGLNASTPRVFGFALGEGGYEVFSCCNPRDFAHQRPVEIATQIPNWLFLSIYSYLLFFTQIFYWHLKHCDTSCSRGASLGHPLVWASMPYQPEHLARTVRVPERGNVDLGESRSSQSNPRVAQKKCKQKKLTFRSDNAFYLNDNGEWTMDTCNL